MSLEQTIKDTLLSESVDLDMRLQQLVRAGLMPANTLPLLRKGIAKVQGGYPLVGAERDVMANFLNAMMFIVLGDDSIFNKARTGAKHYATEEIDKDLEDELKKTRQTKKSVEDAKEKYGIKEGENKEMKGKDPCWKGYEMVGTKKKGGKEVPNCVPANEEVEQIDEVLDTPKAVKSYKTKAEKSFKDAMWKHDKKSVQTVQKRLYGLSHKKVDEEALDEVSDKTKASYASKASSFINNNAHSMDPATVRKWNRRQKGMSKLRKEEARADIAAFTQMNESYKTTFNAALEQYGIKSPSELDEEKRKEFFNFVDQNYKKGDN